MAVALKQSKVDASYGTTLTFDSPIVAGDLLVIRLFGGPSAVSDNLNGAWSKADVTNGMIWYVIATQSGSCTVTWTGGVSARVAAEFSGVAGVRTGGGYHNAVGTDLTTDTAGVNPSGAGKLIVCGFDSLTSPFAAITFTPGSSDGVPWTIAAQGNDAGSQYAVVLEYILSGSAGQQVGAATADTVGSWQGNLAVFDPIPDPVTARFRRAPQPVMW